MATIAPMNISDGNSSLPLPLFSLTPNDHNPLQWLFCGLFGVIGVFLRFGLGEILSIYFASWWKSYFPLLNFLINVSGSFFIGIIYSTLIVYPISPSSPHDVNSNTNSVAIGLLTGLMGGFTTFSGYALDVIKSVSEFQIYYSLPTTTVSTPISSNITSSSSSSSSDVSSQLRAIGICVAVLTPFLCIAACAFGCYVGLVIIKNNK